MIYGIWKIVYGIKGPFKRLKIMKGIWKTIYGIKVTI